MTLADTDVTTCFQVYKSTNQIEDADWAISGRQSLEFERLTTEKLMRRSRSEPLPRLVLKFRDSGFGIQASSFGIGVS